MDSTASSPSKSMGLMANARRRKGSFVHFFMMTGILMLSLRSLGQKYRIRDLVDDNSDLKEEKESLSIRMKSTRESLLQEASIDPSGLLKSHLDRLFAAADSTK